MFGKIIGTGSYIPEKIVSNEDISSIVDTTEQWIEERTGIDFFSALDDSIENETEKNINLSEWKNCLN